MHDGKSQQGFAPSIQISELPVDLTVHLDCTAGTFSVLRAGRLLGGPFVFDGLQGKKLHLAVASGDFRSKFTIVQYTPPSPSGRSNLPPPAKRARKGKG